MIYYLLDNYVNKYESIKQSIVYYNINTFNVRF